jgi:hypothetical protein
MSRDQSLNATWPMFKCHMGFDQSKLCLTNQIGFDQSLDDHHTKPPIEPLMNTHVA